jgi:acetyltransferase-like isoleucine patch superfamily enzyme
VSGTVHIHEYVFFGHNVCCITGTHNYRLRDHRRMTSHPTSGRDIEIRRGAWIGSNVTLLGPCIVGEDAVIAAGAVVIGNVPAAVVVAGVPAKTIRQIDFVAETV